jgi:Kef-type K+ transport system membrane component KefB
MAMGVEPVAIAVVIAAALAIIFRRFNQPTVTAYILTGIILGPALFNITSNSESVQLFSELGLAFLLFLIGLEMDVDDVREILRPTLLIGLVQMVFMFGSGLLIGQLVGFTFIQSVFSGIFLMFSSTAVVVKMLSDKDQITSLPGRLNVSILLLQDVVVVLMLAVLNTGVSSFSSFALGISETIVFILFAAAFSVFSSKYLLKHLFNSYAEEKHGFLIYAVAWLFIFIEISQILNFSVEIGAFLAGVGMGRLKISEEVMERIRPLTDVFMAVFFLGVGLELTESAITAYWAEALIFSALIVPLKFFSEFILTDYSKFSPETSFMSSLNMTQISEFSIILASLAASKHFISSDFVGFATLTAITTMTVSSYFITYNREIYSRFDPYLEFFRSEDKTDVDVGKLSNHAVLVGYDRMTSNVLPAMEEVYDDILIIDSDPDNVEELSRSKYSYIYGDFRHGEIRNSARLQESNLVISVSADHNVNLQILEDVEEVTTFLKAKSDDEALELYELGAHYVIRENILTAEKLGNYLELYLEDRRAFETEIKAEKEKIRWYNR